MDKYDMFGSLLTIWLKAFIIKLIAIVCNLYRMKR